LDDAAVAHHIITNQEKLNELKNLPNDKRMHKISGMLNPYGDTIPEHEDGVKGFVDLMARHFQRICNEHFENLDYCPDIEWFEQTNQWEKEFREDHKDEICDEGIITGEVWHVFSKCNKKSAPGKDGINYRLLNYDKITAVRTLTPL